MIKILFVNSKLTSTVAWSYFSIHGIGSVTSVLKHSFFSLAIVTRNIIRNDSIISFFKQEERERAQLITNFLSLLFSYFHLNYLRATTFHTSININNIESSTLNIKIIALEISLPF
jgi:hypothetical protein